VVNFFHQSIKIAVWLVAHPRKHVVDRLFESVFELCSERRGFRNESLRAQLEHGHVDGDKHYLTLHGARRGVGERYYREGSVEAARRVLRYDDPETTSKIYSHIEASDLSKTGDEVFKNE